MDPALTAEVALRLALVFEASAALEAPNQKTRSGKSMRLDDSLSKQMDEDHSMASQSGKGEDFQMLGLLRTLWPVTMDT